MWPRAYPPPPRHNVGPTWRDLPQFDVQARTAQILGKELGHFPFIPRGIVARNANHVLSQV